MLSGLTPSTKYFYIIESRDASGNTGTSALETYTFTTGPGPVISNVSVTSVFDEEVTVTWKTDVPATSWVIYSENPDISDPAIMSGVAMGVTSHSVTLTGLSRGTTHYFYVRSTDANEDIAEDKNVVDGVVEYFNFTTTEDTQAPVVSDTEASLVAHNGATVTWETDESATSKLRWGLTTDLDQETIETSFYTTKHSVSIEGLTSETSYYYEVVSVDRAGNSITDDNDGSKYSFTTPNPFLVACL